METAKIKGPALFIAGKKDPVLSFDGGGWGDLMDHFVPDLRGKVYVDGAGHWVQMGRPEAVTDALPGVQFCLGTLQEDFHYGRTGSE